MEAEISAPVDPQQTERETRQAAEAAALGAELARIAGELGVRLPAPGKLHGWLAKFENPPGSPSPARARIWLIEDAPGPDVFLSEGTVTLAIGPAPDLRSAVAAVAAWLETSDLAAVDAIAPFLSVEDWALAHQRQPLDPVELAWRTRMLRLRTRIHRPFPAEQAMWAAAFAEPRMRRLWPLTSHWTLWFSATPDLPFERMGVLIEPRWDGTYRVGFQHADNLVVEAATAEEAIALAAQALPPAD